MNIDFNSFFRMSVNVTQFKEDQYQLSIERVDLEDEFYSSKSEFFLNGDQLKQLVHYFKEVGDKNGIL